MKQQRSLYRLRPKVKAMMAVQRLIQRAIAVGPNAPEFKPLMQQLGHLLTIGNLSLADMGMTAERGS